MNAGNPVSQARYRRALSIAAGLLAATTLTARSQIAWSSDFETLDAGSGSALTDDSWMAYVNVFDSSGTYLYGYASTPPNGGSGFWAVTTDQAGPEQGVQGLSVYGDYYNQAAQTAGDLVEANVFQQFAIFLEDTGAYVFRFDAKAGNLASPSTAQAFIRVLDPGNNYATVASSTFNTSSLPATWGTYSIRIDIDDSMEDMILQFGFSATSTQNAGSGVFYDNLSFGIEPPAPPTITNITKTGNVVNVTFPTETGATYDLFKSIGDMDHFELVVTQPAIMGDGSSKVAADSAATEPSAFYRIRRRN